MGFAPGFGEGGRSPVAHLARGIDAPLDLLGQIAVFADLAREGGQPRRPFAAPLEEPAGRAQGAESRAEVSDLESRKHAVLRRACQGIADFAHSAEGRPVARGENRARLAGLGKALAHACERRFEERGRPGRVPGLISREPAFAERGFGEVHQPGENLRPFEPFEVFCDAPKLTCTF